MTNPRLPRSFNSCLRALDTTAVAAALAIDPSLAIHPQTPGGRDPLDILLESGIPPSRFEQPSPAFEDCLLEMTRAIAAAGPEHSDAALPLILVKLTDAGCHRALRHLCSLPAVPAALGLDTARAAATTRGVNGPFLMSIAMAIATAECNDDYPLAQVVQSLLDTGMALPPTPDTTPWIERIVCVRPGKSSSLRCFSIDTRHMVSHCSITGPMHPQATEVIALLRKAGAAVTPKALASAAWSGKPRVIEALATACAIPLVSVFMEDPSLVEQAPPGLAQLAMTLFSDTTPAAHTTPPPSHRL